MKTLNYNRTRIACYIGYVTQAIVNNLAPLLFILFQQSFGLSYEKIGTLIFVNFVTQLIVDTLAAKYCSRIGYRPSVLAAHFCSALGLILMGVLPFLLEDAYLGLIFAVICYAIGGGLIEVLISPIIEGLPSDGSRAGAMSLLHSFYCWGQVAVVLISTLALRGMGGSSWRLLPILWAAVPLINFFLFLRAPIMPVPEEEGGASMRSLLSQPLFLVSLLLMLCAGASELTMSQWASLFAQKGLGVSKTVGDLLGPCLFAVLMGIGRVVYSLFSERVDLRKLLTASSMLCVVCYLTAVFSPLPILGLAGCAVCGLSIAIMWPGCLSLTSARFPRGGLMMFGMLAIFGDLGCASGPWLAGLISDFACRLTDTAARFSLDADAFGLKCGLLVGVLFPLVLIVALQSSKDKQH